MASRTEPNNKQRGMKVKVGFIAMKKKATKAEMSKVRNWFAAHYGGKTPFKSQLTEMDWANVIEHHTDVKLSISSIKRLLKSHKITAEKGVGMSVPASQIANTHLLQRPGTGSETIVEDLQIVINNLMLGLKALNVKVDKVDEKLTDLIRIFTPKPSYRG